MKQKQIQIGKRYKAGNGQVREVGEITNRWDYEKVMVEYCRVENGVCVLGGERICSRQAFARWASAEVKS